MVVFELKTSKPTFGSDKLYVRCLDGREVPVKYWGKSFTYTFSDGEIATITLTQLHAKEAQKLERKSSGFCGYEWMIRSIIKNGNIRLD